MSVRWPRVLNPTQLSQLIRTQKNPLTALQIFNEAKFKYPIYHHNGAVYATIIEILRRSGRIFEMQHVINQMQEDSCECKDQVFTSLINTYAKAGKSDDAISLFRSLGKFNSVNWTASFNALLKIMVEEYKLETFHSLFLEYGNAWEVKSRIESLNLLMGALCYIGRSNLALEVFQEMSLQCCSPNRESYKILMTALCEDERLNEAIHLLYSMFWMISEKGCGGDITIYRTLLNSLIDHGHAHEALEMLGKVLRKGLKASKRCRRKLAHFSQIYGTEDKQQAKSTVLEALMGGLMPSTASYSAVIVDLYSEGNIEEANKFLTEMREKGYLASSMVYEAKVSAMCKAGMVEDAVRVVEEEMVRWSCVPTSRVINVVVRGLCEIERTDLAMKLVNSKMVKHRGSRPDKDTYEVLVIRLCKDQTLGKATKIVERMLSSSLRPGYIIFDALVRGLWCTERRYEAVLWLEEMISHGMVPETSLWDALVGSYSCFDNGDTGADFEMLIRQT